MKKKTLAESEAIVPVKYGEVILVSPKGYIIIKDENGNGISRPDPGNVKVGDSIEL